MRDIAGTIGWIVAFGYVFAMLNFILKLINKKYIVKLPKDKKRIVDIYRQFMKYFIKYHKLVGIIAVLAVVTHFAIMSIFVEISITGIISAMIMFGIGLFGVYGAFINKNFKGQWLKIHRIFAFSLVIFIAIHII